MKDSFKDDVSSELRSLRAKRNLKQKDVASKAQIDVMTLNRYENNSSSMQLDIIEKILKVYDLDCYIFFNTIYANKHNKDNLQ